MRTNQYYENLIKRVIDLSESNVWERAVLEWEIFDCEIDDSLTESCVCGKEHLRYLFTIRNIKNGNELYPIGSKCINKFDRDDLDYEVSVYEDMFRLIRAVENNEYIELTSEYFSRKLLGYLLDNDAFEPNEYNDFDGENDYDFMLEMFNKRNKDEIYASRQRKINAIIANSILPFVHSRIKLKSGIESQTCPRCGADLVIRTVRSGAQAGTKFLGCSKYPNCRYTQNIK